MVATTAESIIDIAIWIRTQLLAAARWLAIGTVLVGLVIVAAWFTGRETFGDCSAITPEQRSLLSSLDETTSRRSFRAGSEPGCGRGVFAVSVAGLDGDIDDVLDDLAAVGWIATANLWPIDYDLQVHCLRLNKSGWETIELNVSASRAGMVSLSEVRATEAQPACRPFSCASLSTGCQRWDRLDQDRADGS